MRPRVTVIIPTYDRAGLVGRAIRSVLDQDYANVEVLVVDDGSTDDTPRVLQAFETDPRVRTLRHEPNRGVTAAKNRGLDSLDPETVYFGILDSDDLLLPGALDLLVAGFETGPDAYSQVFGWCRDSEAGNDTGRMVRREGIVTYDDAIAGRFAGEFWQLARRDLLDGRRFEPRAAGGELSVWWPLLRQRPAWLVPEAVRTYDVTGVDRVSVPRYTRAAADGKRWVYVSVLAAVGADMRAGYPRQYGEMMAELAKWAGLAGDGRQARAASRAALRYAPSRRSLLVWSIAWLPAGILRRVAERRARSSVRAEPAPVVPEPTGRT